MSGKPRSSLKSIFFAGLVVTLPLAFTIFVFHFIFVNLDQFLGPLVTKLLIKLRAPITSDFRVPGLGLFTTFVIIFLVGLFTRNIAGRRLVRLGEAILVKIPVFKNIYVGAKQVIETISASSSRAFSKVVLVEYPRQGIYALAFITGESRGEVGEKMEKEMINVFLPTTPNPTSGFFLLVPKDEIIELDMSVEDGVKMLISAGLVVPGDKETLLDEKTKQDKGDGR